MENKAIVYDKILEVEETMDFVAVNQLLKEYQKIDDTTCLVWDIISCIGVYSPRSERIETVYTLGLKYKRIDHINK